LTDETLQDIVQDIAAASNIKSDAISINTIKDGSVELRYTTADGSIVTGVIQPQQQKPDSLSGASLQWKIALDQLELKVSQGNFLTWFRNTSAKTRTKNTLFIETKNPFAYEWLSKKYRPLILETIQGIDKTVTDVRFSIASKNTEKRIVKKNLRVVAQKNPATQLQRQAISSSSRNYFF
jgi:hypothetical protein